MLKVKSFFLNNGSEFAGFTPYGLAEGEEENRVKSEILFKMRNCLRRAALEEERPGQENQKQ